MTTSGKFAYYDRDAEVWSTSKRLALEALSALPTPGAAHDAAA